MSIWNSINTDRTNLPEIDMTKVDKDEIIKIFEGAFKELNNTYYHILPKTNFTQPCMWDTLREECKRKPMMLSCPCPKCSIYC